MNNQLNNLQHLASKGMIDLDDFYCVTIWDKRITLQGQLTHEKVSGYSEFFELKISKPNGFLTGIAELDGVLIEVTFTF